MEIIKLGTTCNPSDLNHSCSHDNSHSHPSDADHISLPDTGHPYCITAIKPAIKAENRVNIYINDKYDFSLEISQVVDLHIKVGNHLTVRELNDYRHASEFGKLYQHTLEYVLASPHSIKETRDHLENRRARRTILNRQAVKNRTRSKEDQTKFKLRTKELPLYTDQDINSVIDRLVKKGYLDDQKFATYYIENRYIKKGISKKRLANELKKKGIDSDLIQKSLISSNRSDSEEIQKIIAKKRYKYDANKLIAYLVRQGFDYQQSKDAVLEMDSQNSAQTLPY